MIRADVVIFESRPRLLLRLRPARAHHPGRTEGRREAVALVDRGTPRDGRKILPWGEEADLMNCEHKNIVDPPPGKKLRICLDCCKRLIECSRCDAVTTARPDIADSGWVKRGWMDGGDKVVVSECPDCA